MSVEIIIMKSGDEKKKARININDSIRQIKEKCGERGATWIFNGNILMDNKCISEYDIEDGDIIISTNTNSSSNSNCSMQIILRHNNGTQTPLHVNTNDKIRQIKEKCGEEDRCWRFNAQILKDINVFRITT